MKIDRDVKRLGSLEKRGKFRIVQKLPVHCAIHHDALEPELAHAALEFSGSLFWLLQRQSTKSGESVRMGLDCGGENIIGVAGQSLCGDGHEFVNRTRGNREHLQIDTGSIHICESSRPGIEQLGVKCLDKGAR